MDEDDRTQRGLQLVDEALTKGQLTMETGKVVALSAAEILRCAQWAAQHGRTPRAPLPLPDGFLVRQPMTA